MATRSINGFKNTFAFETLTIGVAASGLTVATYEARSTAEFGTNRMAEYATISVETAPIRYRTDGTAPTASIGHLLNPGDVVYLSGYDDIKNFKAIRTGSDSTIMVSYA